MRYLSLHHRALVFIICSTWYEKDPKKQGAVLPITSNKVKSNELWYTSNLFRYEGTTLERISFAWTLVFLNPATIQSRSGVVELKATHLWRHTHRLCLQSDGLSVASSFQGIERSLRELSQGNRVNVREVGDRIPLLLPWWRYSDMAVHCLGEEGHVLFEACIFFSLSFTVLETLWDLNSILCSCLCLQARNQLIWCLRRPRRRLAWPWRLNALMPLLSLWMVPLVASIPSNDTSFHELFVKGFYL